jgi:streptomycin 6-kinase
MRKTGERSFDFANIFTNPDLTDPTRPVAIEPGRFARRLDIVIEVASLERERLLRWILAWTGLSAAWFLTDGDSAAIDLRVAQLAAAELDRSLSAGQCVTASWPKRPALRADRCPQFGVHRTHGRRWSWAVHAE